MIVVDRQDITEQLIEQLETFDNINIIATYTNPYESIKEIKSKKPDIVFMNIKMSNINGLAIAKYMKEINPNMNVVFVTTYTEYAVQAFEINVLDYIVYPVEKERLQLTVNRIDNQQGTRHSTNTGIYVCCFGNLVMRQKGEDRPINIRWRTRKTEELFAYLLLHNNQNVRKDLLVDTIWPYIDWRRGISQLYSAIYQIRKTLREMKINIEIKSSDQYYILHLNGIELDINHWESLIQNLPPLNEQTVSDHLQVIYDYKGEIFRDLDYIWSGKEKDRLHQTWLYQVNQVTKFLLGAGKYIQVINIYHHMQVVDPLSTKSYYMLMQLYAYMNNSSAVKMQYAALKNMLAREFDIEPDDYIKQWYKEWCDNKVVHLESIY